MSIASRVSALRKIMEDRNIDAYIIPSADNHQSEYVGEHFKSRQYISGFKGSAGTVVVTKEKAGLWTDGRYFIQAEKELAGSGIDLFKMGEEGVPTVNEFVIENIKTCGKLGFDGRLIAAGDGLELKEELEKKNVIIKYDEDLIDLIWEDRPALSEEKAFVLDVKYAGESFQSKINRIRNVMRENGATTHVVTTLDEVAWIFNIRGNDVSYTPVVLAYAAITLDRAYLFINENKLDDSVKLEFNESNIEIKPYNDVYDFIKELDEKEVIMLDPERVNYSLYNNISENIKKVEIENPAVLMKAMKNKTELKNIESAYIKDGVACTKFMYWLKTNVGKIEISELSASEKLLQLRKEQEGFVDLSFETIAGYKEHAAMMHYAATEESDYKIKAEHMFLVDSGGHYLEGTTDITRTYILGEISEELKTHYTAVARGMINLSQAKFLHGCRGYNLDILARGPMWDMGIDYKCGTGHGVGYMLSVHEGPAGFRWYIVPAKHETTPFEEGMVITNEPGIYMEGSHGIRIENQLVVKKLEKNINGQFMAFDAITMCPIDLDGINPSLMTEREKSYLNDYHKNVYETISPYLNEEERNWLKEYTRAI
ncbi:aminopeptidase P family protein [Terrisporobacter petrolearius]|uniref:aminopeptidase P family protein n=1 Tax=Terrisporobacter petrolearius TaxID=1460447 RepID=UPI0031CC54F7